MVNACGSCMEGCTLWWCLSACGTWMTLLHACTHPQVGEMQRLLDEAGISHRDCFERGELLQRLQESEGRLQGDLRVRAAAAMPARWAASWHEHACMHPACLNDFASAQAAQPRRLPHVLLGRMDVLRSTRLAWKGVRT